MIRALCSLIVVVFTALTPLCHADFDYPDFSSIDGLNLVEDANQAGTYINLTPNAASQKGALWTLDPQPIAAGFSTTFVFEHAAAFGGADGMAFVVQNAGIDALGNHASALGYGGFLSSPDDGIPFSVAVEFDDYQNTNMADPSANHVSVQSRGADPNSPHFDYSLGYSDAIPPLAGMHTGKVEYESGVLSVYVDDLDIPALTVALDLVDLVGGSTAYIGFTAGTGGEAEEHNVHSWSFTALGVGQTFQRGDANGDGAVGGLIDGLYVLNYGFVPGSPAPPCLDAADADDSGSFSALVDGLYILNYQFVPGSPPPPDPGPATCGPDPTDDGLGCNVSACP